ncbi:MAG: bifunctional DNA primase/polymerase, partial [Actinobacteria bacterium]|nr:bifunctional DNA primase/polymerase [Actinomycetota bacterium]
MQWLSSPLDRLRDGARELAAREWPIAPAHYVSTPGRHRRHGRHRLAGEVCSCRDVRCGRPGAHPLSADWHADATIDPFTVGCWWYGPQPWNILLPTGLMFDVWSAPFDVASRALETLRSSGCPIGPVAHSPNGEWLFFTEARPAQPPIELPHTVAV